MGDTKRKSSQPAPENVTPLIAPIQALQSLLSQFDEQGVIIGGVAVSLYWVEQFGEALEKPELWIDIEKYL